MVRGWLGGSRQGAGAGLMKCRCYLRPSICLRVRAMTHTPFSSQDSPDADGKPGAGHALDRRETSRMKIHPLIQFTVAAAVLVVVLDFFPGGGKLLVELAQALAPVLVREKIRLVAGVPLR